MLIYLLFTICVHLSYFVQSLKNGKEKMEKEWKKGRKKIRARAGPLAREPV